MKEIDGMYSMFLPLRPLIVAGYLNSYSEAITMLQKTHSTNTEKNI